MKVGRKPIKLLLKNLKENNRRKNKKNLNMIKKK